MEDRFFHLYCRGINKKVKPRLQKICNSVHNFYTAIFYHHQRHVTVNVLRQLRAISIAYIQQFSVHSKVGLLSAYNPKKGEQTLRITERITLTL